LQKYCNKINKQYGPQHRSDLVKYSCYAHEGPYRQVYVGSIDNIDRFTWRHNTF